jgi:hypothetical protein
VKDLAWDLDRLGRDQHSVVTWNQLPAAGATAWWIKQEIRAGRLIPMGPRTYRFCGAKRSWQARAKAAVLSARAPALVSHRRAAYLWGIAEHMPGIIDVTLPRHRRPRARIGVQFHESRSFEVAAPAVRDGIPVTGVARTILDCCAVVEDPLTRLELFDEARRLKLVDRDALWTCSLTHATTSRRPLRTTPSGATASGWPGGSCSRSPGSGS